ncbi:type III polyketide synthase [Azospirillum sp. SYSU D00513]|uniref:type III polyketide synthase n=1 Tax=Azospirillum sp. SYSU D00513 TaxID=2812561 RepID=UPI001A96ED41|nr:type III polyketide synthase [Azospirillum sp. SYSU D00513]
MATPAYINRIATAVPPHDVHDKFLQYAPSLLHDERRRHMLGRMAQRAGIEHRYSVIEPDPDPERLDRAGLFERDAFPSTAARMALYERHAPDLAVAGVEALKLTEAERPTHVIVTTCTGLHAPGIDLEIVKRLGLDRGVERTVVGFMGCYAAINGLKLAHHIVRSEPSAKVLMVNIELCTLHMQETGDLESLLSFMIFADGCAACLISAEPEGVEMLGFDATVIPDSEDQITWHIRGQGFDMHLSGAVPATVARGLPEVMTGLRDRFGIEDFSLWAVHPGGRSVLDAVELSLSLPSDALGASREVLRRYGNMSSATVMFVLKALAEGSPPGRNGVAMAFGPGLTAETMVFRTAGENRAERRA